MKTLSFKAHSVKVADASQGIIEAIVSVFSVVDCYEERILPGFFANSLKVRTPKGVWMHDWMIPVAKTLESIELMPGDERLPEEIRQFGGLYIKGQFNLNTQRGREAFSDIEFGIIDEYSIGFTVQEERFNKTTGITDLISGTLYEWSPVLVGANPATATISAKSLRFNAAKPDGVLCKAVTQLGAEKGIKLKGAMLGESVERWMTMAALRELDDALWYAVWYALANTETTKEEKLAHLRACYEEYSGTALMFVEAILEGTAAQTSEEATAEIQGVILCGLPMLNDGSTSPDSASPLALRERHLKLHQLDIDVLNAHR